ncbi:MAG: hypothetical protein WCS43_00530 [Verrucomicrobiota bacterium]
MNIFAGISTFLAVASLGISTVSAAAKKAEPADQLNATGTALEKKYAEMLKASQADVGKALPKVDASKQAAFAKARDEAKAGADELEKSSGKLKGAQALVEHAKGKWIGGAEKGIKQAEAALKKAATDAERDAAKKDLAKWQANKEDGVKALKERQAALDKLKAEDSKSSQSAQTVQTAKARAEEAAAAKGFLAVATPTLSSDKLDATLVKGAVLAEATPRGLAEFAQQGKEQEALVGKLLGDNALMKQMLEAGGAKFGKYGKAMEIYTAIRKASPKSSDGALQRLALAVSLEHAKPIGQSNAKDQTNAPATVDPVKRYLHYEKAYLDGELDPAFKTLTTWEYRMAVDCDAPDEILTWGREMLRNYRPDHIYAADYGWRYSSTVKTEVPYGSQNQKYDLDSLQQYQNIIKDGGVCGRRAFFGRFILQCFGIPVWGVTQHAHAALSHWTPKGWVVNLGAGYQFSWWDKDEAPRSGSDFLLETQAREHGPEYLQVLRAQWISRILGEQAYNDRKGIAGGFWSGMAHYQMAAIASTAVGLGPLGQELGEANEPVEKQKVEQVKMAEGDQKIATGKDGVITIPAVAHSKPSGRFAAMKSFSGGMQLHASGGYKAEYEVDAPRAGKYALSARVVTAQEGQKFLIAANGAGSPVEIAVPYTIGKWKQTQPVEVTLVSGKNHLSFAIQDGSRGVTIKEITLTPAK